LLSDTFTVSQAKRVYALIGAGGLLGATAGSVLAAGLLEVMGAAELVLVAAGVFAMTSTAPGFVRVPPAEETPRRADAGDEAATRGGLSFLRAHPYLRRLALIVIVSTVTVTVADFLFKSVVASEVSPDNLGTFFAQFYAGLNAAALIVQLGLASWLLRTIGVSRTLTVMPALILAGALGFLLAPTLALALVLKGTDGTLRHSVQRTSSELLYVPLPAEVRHRFKAFIDAVGQRGGQAFASLGILAAIALGADAWTIAAGTAVLAAIWVVTIHGVQRHYLELFRQQLRGGSIDLRVELPALDLHQLELLMQSLNSEDDATVVAALDMLREHDKINLIPALILYHPSRDVVLRALELFAEARRTDFSSVALRLMDGDDNEIRAAAVRAKSAVDPEQARLREFLDDRSARVRATAQVALITNNLMNAEEIETSMRDVIENGSLAVRRALAQAIHYQPDDRLAWVLIELGRGKEHEIQLEVAQAIATQPHLKFLPTLLRMLPHRVVRTSVRDAILAIGPSALDFLDGALADHTLEPATRRHIPRTISKFDSPRAASILLAHLPIEPDGMTRFKILRGLGRMQTNNPRLPLDRAVLRKAARRTLERIATVLTWRTFVEAEIQKHPARDTRGAELMISLFKEKQRNATERLFRLLDLLTPKENFRLIYAGVTSSDPKARSSSMELLEHLVEPELRVAVLTLVDDIPDTQRVAQLHAFHRPAALGYAELLRTLLDDPSEAVRCIAAYHIGELGLEELREPLASARPERASYLRDVVEHALALLRAPREEIPQRVG
jgi:HEAT repeat protein